MKKLREVLEEMERDRALVFGFCSAVVIFLTIIYIIVLVFSKI